MIFPRKIKTYCPHCRKHTIHTVKVSTSKYKAGRTLAVGTRRHNRKLKGMHGKVKGKAIVKKQGIRQKVMLTCTVCKKKHEVVVTGRMKKKLELKK